MKDSNTPLARTDKLGRTTVDAVELLKSERAFLRQLATKSNGERVRQQVIHIEGKTREDLIARGRSGTKIR